MSGSRRKKKPHRCHCSPDRQRALGKAEDHILLANGVVGRIEDHEDLHQLRRLEVEHIKREPAARAIHHLAHARDQHDHQQHKAEQEQPLRPALPLADGHRKGKD